MAGRRLILSPTDLLLHLHTEVVNRLCIVELTPSFVTSVKNGAYAFTRSVSARSGAMQDIVTP
eukprot:36962-Eustigmatos_ZCMA.PRE.1